MSAADLLSAVFDGFVFGAAIAIVVLLGLIGLAAAPRK